MSEYRIPIRHERGTYTLAEVEVTDEYNGDTMVITCDDCDIITNSMNDITLYSFHEKIQDVLEIIYRHPMQYNGREYSDNLESVFIKHMDGTKYPIYLEYKNEFFTYQKKQLFADMQNIVLQYTDRLLEELNTAKLPLNPLQLLYYRDSISISIVLFDLIEEKNYPVNDEALNIWCSCVVNSVPEWYGNAAFNFIISGIYNRLEIIIPEKFRTTEIYELNLPEEID